MIQRCSTYTIINICFACIAAGVLLYATLYTNNHPIPSLLTNHTGISTPSYGLSRSFSMIIRGDIEDALAMNPHSVRVFIFFAAQLAMRLVAIALAKRIPQKATPIVATDIVLSIALFAYCFAPLIAYTFKQFALLLQ